MLVLFKGITGIVFAVYLDSYGEEDIKLERGLPMTYDSNQKKQKKVHLVGLEPTSTIKSYLASCTYRYTDSTRRGTSKYGSL